MPAREWRLRVQDILDAIGRARSYVDDEDLAEFLANEQAIDAISYCFGIIGEAARHVPQAITDAHPEIPWNEMRAMRNVLIHEYFGVTRETLWRTARDRLPELVAPLEKLLGEHDGS